MQLVLRGPWVSVGLIGLLLAPLQAQVLLRRGMRGKDQAVRQLAGSAHLLQPLPAPLGLRQHLGGLAWLCQVAPVQAQLALDAFVLELQGQGQAVAVAAVPVERLCWE